MCPKTGDCHQKYPRNDNNESYQANSGINPFINDYLSSESINFGLRRRRKTLPETGGKMHVNY